MLKSFVKKIFLDSKADLFSTFIERSYELAKRNGSIGLITMQSWMFLASYERLRKGIINQRAIVSMVHLGARAFDSISGEVVSTTAFVINNYRINNFIGRYFRLVNGKSEFEKRNTFKKLINNSKFDGIFNFSSEEFKKISGSPIAYWISSKMLNCFSNKKLMHYMNSEGALKTGNNTKFIRFLWEVNKNDIGSNKKWRKHPKGGPLRKWYGNLEHVVDWSEAARQHYRKDRIARIPINSIWDVEGITWSAVSTGGLSFRKEEKDEIANNAALFIYPKNQDPIEKFLCCLNSAPVKEFIKVISPTLNFLVGDVLSIPFPKSDENIKDCNEIYNGTIETAKCDWDLSETSWNFTTLRLLNLNHHQT